MSNGCANPALKLDVLVVFFAYGGNGGVAMQLPAIGKWWAETLLTLKADNRVGRIGDVTLSDTPITMTRNRAVKLARDGGFHVLVMIDSDNEPDLYLAQGGAKPFWNSSFDFLYERYKVGLPTVIAAPYCGPPPHPVEGGEENVYVFHWTGHESDSPTDSCKLEAYSRAQASQMAGIHPAGALPTGCLMASVNAFDLTCVEGKPVAHFYYEYTDGWETDKGSTEDVTATRDISLAGHVLLEQEVVFCNWDCWAGHHKPKCVGRPKVPSANTVGKVLVESIQHGIDPAKRWRYINARFPRYQAQLSPEQAMNTIENIKAGTPPVNRLPENWQPSANGNGKPHDDPLADVRGWLSNVIMEHASYLNHRKLRCVDASGVADAGIAYALCGQGAAYAYIVSRDVGEMVCESDDIRPIEEDPIEYANAVDAQDADVVWCGDSQTVVEMWERHVALDGMLCGMSPAKPPAEWKVTQKEGGPLRLAGWMAERKAVPVPTTKKRTKK